MTVTKNNEKYLAPALLKGLEVLELLSSKNTPINLQTICDELKMSKNQLFRTVVTLYSRGYIEKYPGDTYMITSKLFNLGIKTPSKLSLLEVANPIMKEVTDLAKQSCHLAIRSGIQMVITHRVESTHFISLAISVGYRKNLTKSSSGLVLLANLNEEEQANIIQSIASIDTSLDIAELKQQLAKIKVDGHVVNQNFFLKYITDISVPLCKIENPDAIATLTVPYIDKRLPGISVNDTLDILKNAAKKIEKQL